MEERKEYPYTPDHVHDYFGRTSVDLDHFHTFVGSTAVAQYVAGGHVHSYASETRVAQNHTHIMNGTSGIEVPVLMGHLHQLGGTTTVNNNHSHTYDLYTGYPRAPRNVKRQGVQATGAADKTGSGETSEKRRPRFKLRFRSPSSEQKQC